jgi:D-alanyl-D-alanine carboxypeptidase
MWGFEDGLVACPLLRRALCAALLLVLGPACTTEPAERVAEATEGPVAPEELTGSSSPVSSCRSRRHPHFDPDVADAGWERRIEGIVGDLPVGVAVGIGGRLVYAHAARRPRVPASNQKLLLSFALLDRLGSDYRIPTRAAATDVEGGTVTGDLWVMGRGDPTLTADEPGYWGDVEATTLAELASKIERAGVRQITGRVMAATGYFEHDLAAPGWQPYVPRRYVQIPTSLVLNGNHAGAASPERAVAAALTKQLEKTGVSVNGDPGAGAPPVRSTPVTRVGSRPLTEIVAYMNHTSNNFFAETLGKLLGAEVYGPPGTIQKGARAIESWASAHGVHAVAHDSSGLSYRNRISPRSIVELLGVAETKPWGRALRDHLPGPGEGTLRYRLPGLQVRAKTGTLFNGASSLSGWVRSAKSGRWAAFSILDRSAPKAIEDRIVRVISRARVRAPRPDSPGLCVARPYGPDPKLAGSSGPRP